MSSFRTHRKTKFKENRIDLTDTSAFPSLSNDDASPPNIESISSADTDTHDMKPKIPFHNDDDTSCHSEQNNDTLPDGWITLTRDDARKPKSKPDNTTEIESESDDEDTMPMTTKKKPHVKPKSEPYVERTGAEILELFRIELVRHNREIEDRENGFDDFLYDLYEDEWEQQRKWELYINSLYESEPEEEEEYYEDDYDYD